MTNYKEQLKDITTFIFDYDGVLTEGIVWLTENGEPLRTANVRDGYALQLAIKKGYRIAVISGGKSVSTTRRLASLGITDVFLGVEHKIDVFNDYLLGNGLTAKEVLYMGDDIPDLKPMERAGIAACPADASEEVRAVSDYISHHNGGKGCVRDIIEQVMKLQNKWMKDDAFTW